MIMMKTSRAEQTRLSKGDGDRIQIKTSRDQRVPADSPEIFLILASRKIVHMRLLTGNVATKSFF